jgi:DnaJ-class molecular chaperone
MRARPRERKRARTFADIDAARKRYDVRDGFGSARQWKGDFYERMGFEQARAILDEQAQTPRQILGVGRAATWEEVVRAYRKEALRRHPDRAALNSMTVEAATESFKRLSAAFTILAREYRR